MTKETKKQGFATRQIHGYDVRVPGINPLATPIFQTSTFVFDDCAQGAARFAGKEEGFIYSRIGNPNVEQVAKKVAILEGAEAGLAAKTRQGFHDRDKYFLGNILHVLFGDQGAHPVVHQRQVTLIQLDKGRQLTLLGRTRQLFICDGGGFNHMGCV